jgi:rubredoxin
MVNLVQTAMRQLCTECTYIYEPDEHGGIPLIERVDWECPGIEGPCGATTDKYVIVEPLSSLSDDDDDDSDEE